MGSEDDELAEAVDKQRRSIQGLCKILDGLTEMASIREAEDAGDWSAVVCMSDLVARSLRDIDANLAEAVDKGDPGDL